MENKLIDLRSVRNPKARIKILEGHFATTHSHINTYIDMSTVKCRHNNARETAKVLAEFYRTGVSVDTVVCLDGTQMIGAFLAETLADNSSMSINSGKNISVITPEFDSSGQMIFRDNTQRMIRNMQVLLLVASATTGLTLNQAVECIEYYGGRACGISTIFSAVENIHGLEVNTIFTKDDLPEYRTYSHSECPFCQKNIPIEALVNSFGYSKL